MRMDPKRINRDFFFARVKRGEGCWEWTGFRDSKGYGRMNVPRADGTQRSSEGAYRVSWVLANGPIPDGLHVLHQCDNPACVRPDHLRLGTHADNMREASERGLMKKPTGSDSAASKLTEAQRREAIEAAYEGVPYPEIGARFGVTGACIYQIRRKHTKDSGELWTPWTVRSPQHMSRWKKTDD